MLIYHPAYDAYHSAFRILLAVDDLQCVELPKLRILDFFLTFPAEVRNIRLPREHMGARKIAERLTNEYHGPVNAKKTFQDMEQIHMASVRALAASNLLDKDRLDAGFAQRTATPIPESFRILLTQARQRESEITEFIISGLGGLRTQGIDGLKDRTALLEYRYDIV